MEEWILYLIVIPSVDEATRRFIPFWVMLYACITESERKTEEQDAAFRSKKINIIMWTHTLSSASPHASENICD